MFVETVSGENIASLLEMKSMETRGGRTTHTTSGQIFARQKYLEMSMPYSSNINYNSVYLQMHWHLRCAAREARD
jgi:hypothetical protein